MEKSEFSMRLHGVIKSCGLTQKKLAEMVGIDRVTISRWKNPKHQPSPGSIARIAQTLGYNPKWLATGEGDPKAYEPPVGTVNLNLGGAYQPPPGNQINLGGDSDKPKTVTAVLDQPIGDAPEDIERQKFNQDMESLLRMITKWQADEHGADTLTSMNFLAEFHKRFPELQEWIKKQKGADHTVPAASKSHNRKTA